VVFNEKAFFDFPVSFNVSNKTCPELVEGMNFQQNWLNENKLFFSNEFLIVKMKMKFSDNNFSNKNGINSGFG